MLVDNILDVSITIIRSISIVIVLHNVVVLSFNFIAIINIVRIVDVIGSIVIDMVDSIIVSGIFSTTEHSNRADTHSTCNLNAGLRLHAIRADEELTDPGTALPSDQIPWLV